MIIKPICNEQEATTKSRLTFAWSFMLLAFIGNPFAQADDVPILPSQYAEAVLDVEGMI